jgi:hypothetical protein
VAGEKFYLYSKHLYRSRYRLEGDLMRVAMIIDSSASGSAKLVTRLCRLFQAGVESTVISLQGIQLRKPDLFVLPGGCGISSRSLLMWPLLRRSAFCALKVRSDSPIFRMPISWDVCG